jgi:hypothetical protein
MQVLDYDKIDDWSPLFSKALGKLSSSLSSEIKAASPEFIEDARDLVVSRLGREFLVEQLTQNLSDCRVRLHHGTRLSFGEAGKVAREGLRPLNVCERRQVLTSIFCKHPRWNEVVDRFDQMLIDYGKGQQAGRREDGCIHACFSRTALSKGCSHYLAFGAEVDGHIARALFGDNSALPLLTKAKKAMIVSFQVSFEDALNAANPYGIPDCDLPSIINIFLGAWAYRLANPTFTVASQGDCTAARFPWPIAAQVFDAFTTVEDNEIDFDGA